MALSEKLRQKAIQKVPEGKVPSRLPDRSEEWFRNNKVIIYRGERFEDQHKVEYVPETTLKIVLWSIKSKIRP